MEERMRSLVPTIMILVGLTGVTTAIAQEESGIGEVHFATSCDQSVGADFDRAVALLHSFEFAESRQTFKAVAEADPDCAMAHWGIAMTYYHPLWAPPRPNDVKAGGAAAQAAMAMPSSERESGFTEAISTFYRDYENLDHRTRAIAYEAAMYRVTAENPDDPEAAIFHQLAVLSNADPTDETYAVQRRTGAFLEAMFAEMPKHPGLAHYIIHSYDYPPLSAMAVEAAHRYLEIAPSLAHAVHMSGHIFTQEGMWDASIDANSQSVSNAREAAKQAATLVQAQLGEMHSLDYKVYAFLQQGQNEAAREIVVHIDAFDGLHWENGVVAFNAGAVPVRYALERHAWEEAATLPEATEAEQASSGFENRTAVAMRHWARAVGAARSGDIDAARSQLARVAELAAESRDHPDVWFRNTTEVFRLQAKAWLALAENQGDRALQLMREATVLEDETDKSPLSPGRVLPGHEQLGDMLMELGRPDEAVREYEISLTHAIRRFNSFYGAARAAREAGRSDVARDYYGRLVELAAADSPRTEIAEAREYLASGD
jgi:tetratricopeptide (TPR) repeat protein